MRIATVKGIQYVEHLFDSFCVSKDVNRDPENLHRIAEYLHSSDKKLSVLANSGCLRNCSMQTFHDNAVAHEAQIRSKANIEWAQLAGCREYMSKPENYTAFLQNTWIRPEDLHNLDGVADIIKLATRMHALPTVVVDAYAKRRYHGNLADLFEPGHGPLFAPWVVDNDRFPEDWYEKTTTCNKDCTRCNYCESVRKQVFILPEM
jgi:collagenase-like PrtC family protease